MLVSERAAVIKHNRPGRVGRRSGSSFENEPDAVTPIFARGPGATGPGKMPGDPPKKWPVEAAQAVPYGS